MINWTHIIIHHSLTKDGLTVSWNAIRSYHVRNLGWQDVGYHLGIELLPHGVYEILGGRPLNMAGAHTKGMNEHSIGFCFVGNYDLIEPPEPMLNMAAKFLKGIQEAFKIPLDNIRAHRDYANYKTCPGQKFRMNNFRGLFC